MEESIVHEWGSSRKWVFLPYLFFWIQRCRAFNSRSQTFDEDWWTMLIESSTKWTLNQSMIWVKVFNSLSTPRPKTKNEHCWYFVPCINIKDNEDTYAFNKKLVQHGVKLKWETRRIGWCWFPLLKSGSQTFDEDWWTMLIESNTEWTLNQSYEFKIMNSLSTRRPKSKDEH